MAYNIKVNSNYLLITNTDTQVFTDRPSKDIVICKVLTSDVNYTVYYNGKEIDGLIEIPFTDFQLDGVPFVDELDFENFICENTGSGGASSSGGGGGTFPTSMDVNLASVKGVQLDVDKGFNNTGTQRVIQAYRVEAFLGGLNVNDVAIINGSRVKGLLVTNNTNNVIYIQVHSKATALATGDVPLFGLTIRVPPNSTIDKNAGDYGETGVLYGSNIRFALSSTFGTYTAINPLNTCLSIICNN